jgi:hypothetical protein
MSYGSEVVICFFSETEGLPFGIVRVSVIRSAVCQRTVKRCLGARQHRAMQLRNVPLDFDILKGNQVFDFSSPDSDPSHQL